MKKICSVIGMTLLAATLSGYAQDTTTNTNATTNTQTQDTTKIDSILVSDTPDDKGYVLSSKDVIPSDAKKIYATVQLISGIEGGKVMATLIFLGSKSEIGPVVSNISTTGDTVAAFAFTNTKMPWPKGDYEVDVSTSGGDSKKITFKIND